MKWFINRMKEPSTWAGLAVLLPTVIQAGAQGMTPASVAQIAGGVAAVFMSEKGQP